jgi:hypothetical protein
VVAQEQIGMCVVVDSQSGRVGRLAHGCCRAVDPEAVTGSAAGVAGRAGGRCRGSGARASVHRCLDAWMLACRQAASIIAHDGSSSIDITAASRRGGGRLSPHARTRTATRVGGGSMADNPWPMACV